MDWRTQWRQLQRYFIELLKRSVPNRCIACHQSVDSGGSGICSVCLQAGLYQTPVCLGCGASMTELIRYCGQCQLSMPIKIIAPCSYHQGLGRWIAAIKYQRQFAVLEALTNALHQKIIQLANEDLLSMPQAIIPVPLHPKRQRKRGFNQAWLVAKPLSQQLGLPLLDTHLLRVQATKEQAGLDGKQRRQNLHGAFTLTQPLNVQRVAIVDDVVTTGTTVAEIAKLLARQGISSQVWCLARAEAPELL
ncbi:ComF family protein [Parashewanella tropica]|uniref:ComF family protein n=1 Tax=Parashewanella tropica TaxID=2547970 RepID=UPI0010597868|nr:ComF family protein [Parashewanella tropica]